MTSGRTLSAMGETAFRAVVVVLLVASLALSAAAFVAASSALDCVQSARLAPAPVIGTPLAPASYVSSC